MPPASAVTKVNEMILAKLDQREPAARDVIVPAGLLIRH
jgi:hypothetical protein